MVGSGYSAREKGETLIILEPGSRVFIQGITYEAEDLPMGDWNNIADARPILRNNEKLSSPIIHIGNITLIATGSPILLSPEYLNRK